MKFMIIALLVSLNAQAREVNCSNIHGVSLSADGKLSVRGKDGSLKPLTPKSSTPEKSLYGNPPESSLSSLGTTTQYTVNKVNGKPSNIEVKTHTNLVPNSNAETAVYDVGFTSDGKCFVKSIKSNLLKTVYYETGLCNTLSDLLSEMATPSEINKCSQILSEMASAIKSYKTTLPKGWSLEIDGQMPKTDAFEKALLFAGDCRKRFGDGESAKSLSIQNPERETK